MDHNKLVEVLLIASVVINIFTATVLGAIALYLFS